MSPRFLRLLSALLPLFGLALFVVSASPVGAEESPITGKAVRRLQHLDALMQDILRDHKVPGASLAIAVDGRLVFARGYGWADVENSKPVRPTSRFNLASCSKSITAAAVLKLVDQSKLRLDDKVLALLDRLKPPTGVWVDPRIHAITVRQLLHHAGGLVRDHGPLPEIARRLHVALPVTLSQAAAFDLGKPLLFDPGTEAKYSNLGFLVLRLVVARASGQDYETFTAEHVLKPMGIAAAHLDLLKGYRPREVHRYADGKCLAGGHGKLKGGAGSWVLSTVDAMRFMTSLDGTRGERVLSKRAYQQMLAPLPSLGKKPNERHNGLGWDIVERSQLGVLYSKNGGVAGIATWMEHLPSGVSWAVFFNGNLKGEGDAGKQAVKKPWPLLRAAIKKVEQWPEHDLFDSE
jgi:N-acyl-D-amino-acid deacylase